jgi:hypothetical protein
MNNDNNKEDFNYDPYKFYFQIDTEWLKKYMDDLFKNIDQLGGIEDLFKTPTWSPSILPSGFKPISLPVNSWISSIGETKPSLYLGNNYWNEGVWKKKHFIEDKLGNEYVKHLQSHAEYFLSQPRYYQGLYEILN